MKEFIINGTITDAVTKKPLEGGAKVVLVNQKGNVVDGIGTNADANGKYTLKIPLKQYPNPMNPMIPLVLPASDRIQVRSASVGSHQNQTVVLDFKSGRKEYDVALTEVPIGATKQEEEVVVVAMSNATRCKNEGGVYDSERRQCTFPPKKKGYNKGLIIGAVALVAIVVGIAVYKVSKGSGKPAKA
jgi:hypothetical protein